MTEQKNAKERLLVQACCGPCAIAAVLKFSPDYDVTLFFSGDNFDSKPEFDKRLEALIKVNNHLNRNNEPVIVPYNPQNFYNAIKGLENEPENGKRCAVCFNLRMKQAAEYVKRQGFDAFSTSLTVSPHKDTAAINRIGQVISSELDIPFIAVDLKANGGFQTTVKVSGQLDIYRQNYCGCKLPK